MADRRSRREIQEQDLERALGAMTADELRTIVLDLLDRSGDEERAAFAERLLAGESEGNSGHAPAGPSPEFVGEVERFVEAACRRCYADPAEVDDLLRRSGDAFLAGDYEMARAAFGTILPPIEEAEFDLGQEEIVDDVLSIDLHRCKLQYLVSIYATTPLADRAETLYRALGEPGAAAYLGKPLEEMELASPVPLPDLEAFLPLWAAHLEHLPSTDADENDLRESDRERWLREVVYRTEGMTGLERLARTTKKPRNWRAWCVALADECDWTGALRAGVDGAAVVSDSYWRGEFLDGAALAAQELGRRDTAKFLEKAWRADPSLSRLLRWLGAGDSRVAAKRRAGRALDLCPASVQRQVGLLHLLRGDAHAAAELLASAPGSGWSSDDHPGHVLFPAFAGVLARRTEAPLTEELHAGLEELRGDRFEAMQHRFAPGKATLATPSVAELFALTDYGARSNSAARSAMFEAMRAAATHRVESVLSRKRRRHYGHAARLAAACLELAPVVGEEGPTAEWLDQIRMKCTRFRAFRAELAGALSSIGRRDSPNLHGKAGPA